MQTFIVLGIIPGTHFQTTFTFWLMVGLSLLCLPLAAYLWHKHYALRAYFAARKIARFIDQYQLSA